MAVAIMMRSHLRLKISMIRRPTRNEKGKGRKHTNLPWQLLLNFLLVGFQHGLQNFSHVHNRQKKGEGRHRREQRKEKRKEGRKGKNRRGREREKQRTQIELSKNDPTIQL